MNRRSIKNLGKWIIGLTITVAIVGYALFTSKNLIAGPVIEVTSPENGITVIGATVTITGTAHRIKSLMLDGRSLLVDEKGNFKEVMLTNEGYNVHLLQGEDKFHRKTERAVEFVGKN